MLYGLCLKYLGNEPDAQDAVMDLFESLNEKVSNYTITNFHSWLYAVAKNHCLLKKRKEKQKIYGSKKKNGKKGKDEKRRDEKNIKFMMRKIDLKQGIRFLL